MLKQYFVIDTGVCNKYLKLLVHKYPQTLWSNCKHLLLWYTAKFIKFKHICSTTSSHKHILLPLAYSPGGRCSDPFYLIKIGVETSYFKIKIFPNETVVGDSVSSASYTRDDDSFLGD